MGSLEDIRHNFESLIQVIEQNLDSLDLDGLLQSHNRSTRHTSTTSQSLKRSLRQTVNECVRRSLEEWLEQQRDLATCGERKALPPRAREAEPIEPDTSKPARPPRLEMRQIGRGMISAVSRLVQNPGFRGKIEIMDLPEFNLENIVKDVSCPDSYSSLAVTYGCCNGLPRMYLEEGLPFKLPDFSGLVTKPSDESIERFLDKLLDSPPVGPITYYVGPALNEHFDNLLDPGHLQDLGDLAGINSLYWHAGDMGSGTAFHCEDARMRSANLTIYGYKLWILIRESDTSRFEDYVRTLCSRRLQCDQWVRHQNLLAAPKTLRAAGIQFDVICAGPGDLVITGPRQYHAVINMTACLAVSINFVLSKEPAISPIRVCPHCGLYDLDHANIERTPTRQSTTTNVAKHGPPRANPIPREQATQNPQSRRSERPRLLLSTKGPSSRASNKSNTPAESVTDSLLSVSSQESASSVDAQLPRRHRTGLPLNTPSDATASCTSVGEAGVGPRLSATSQASPAECSATSTSPPFPPSARPPLRQDLQKDLNCPSWPLRSLPPPSPLHLGTGDPDPCSPAPVSGLKRVACASQTQQVPKRHRADDIAEIKHKILDIDKKCNIPAIDTLAPGYTHILWLAAAIRSRHAIQHFCEEINARREPNPEDVSFEIPANTTYDTPQQLQKQLVLNAANRLLFLTRRERHSAAITRIHQYLLAMVCEKAREGGLRLNSNIKSEILKASGLSNNQYDWHLAQGKKWIKVCGDFDGLLCFIFPNQFNPFQISSKQYFDLNDDELRIFHALLDNDYTRSICSAGRAFQQSLGANDVHFKWETPNVIAICELPEKDMLAYLQPFESQETNTYQEDDLPSHQSNPTIVSVSDRRRCDFCDAPACRCILTRLPSTMPRIKRYEGKGLGLQAVSPHPGAVVYKTGALLGFLTGKLTQPGPCDEERAVALDKYQIVCSDMGSCFRLLNHACEEHAVARLKKRKVSGQIMIAVEALQNIRNGSEITICYRPGCNLDCQACTDSFPKVTEWDNGDGIYSPGATNGSRTLQGRKQVKRLRARGLPGS